MTSVVVGVAQIELHLPQARSLKDKRRVIKSLMERWQQRHRVSVAETGYQELHQRSELSVSLVSSSEHRIDQVFDALERAVDDLPEAVRVRFDREVLEYR